MDNLISRSNNALSVFCILGLFLLIHKSGAYEFTVGGSKGWAPSDSNALNQWAESKRFQVGDDVVFVYSPDQDSVLYVTKDDYTSCNTAKPIEKYTDGHSVYKLNQSGPHYFISGVTDKCLKNEKLVIIVMADRSKKYGYAPPPQESIPSPAPTGQESPSPPPAGENSPSPPPAGQNSPPPSPPPAGQNSPPPPPANGTSPSPSPGSEDVNPTPSPEANQTKHHKNAAASITILTNLISFIGALIISSYLLVF